MNRSPIESHVECDKLLRICNDISDGRNASQEESLFMAKSILWLIASMIRETDLK